MSLAEACPSYREKIENDHVIISQITMEIGNKSSKMSAVG
jgi:hypothetical protein